MSAGNVSDVPAEITVTVHLIANEFQMVNADGKRVALRHSDKGRAKPDSFCRTCRGAHCNISLFVSISVWSVTHGN
jgi:hypothetical protein